MISCAILVLLGLCALISTNISVGASFRTAEPVKPAYCNLAAASGAETGCAWGQKGKRGEVGATAEGPSGAQ